VNNPLDVKENDEHVLDFALHLSRFFFFFSGLCEFGLSVYGSSPSQFFRDLHKFVASITKLNRARYTTPNKMT
jgi:hypothetical protein